MAALTAAEFDEAVALLATELGLQRLRDRMVRLNGLVTRRKATSAAALANQLYLLTSGLRRQAPATFAFHAVWTETLNAKVGEEGEKKIGELADGINACLDEHDHIRAEKVEDLEPALAAYREALATAVGADMARLDMVLKAVPAVAEKLRSM